MARRRVPHPLSVELGDRVRALRKERGLTQMALSELTGLARTYVGRMEQGKSEVSFVAVAQVARALGTSVAELVDGLEFHPPRYR